MRRCHIQGNPDYQVLDISRCNRLNNLLEEYRVLVFNEPDFGVFGFETPSKVTKEGNLTQFAHIDNYYMDRVDPRIWDFFSFRGENRGCGTFIVDGEALNPHLEELFEITFDYHSQMPENPQEWKPSIPIDEDKYRIFRGFQSPFKIADYIRNGTPDDVFHMLNIPTKFIQRNLEIGERLRPQLNELYMRIVEENPDLALYEDWSRPKFVIMKNRPDSKGYTAHGRVTLDSKVQHLNETKALNRIWAGNKDFD